VDKKMEALLPESTWTVVHGSRRRWVDNLWRFGAHLAHVTSSEIGAEVLESSFLVEYATRTRRALLEADLWASI
jgi:hypothetical protein